MASIRKRVYPSGGIGYQVQVRLRGHPVEIATFDRLTDAKRWGQQTEAAIREGRHFKSAEAKRHTMAEAIDRYLESVLPHKGAGTAAGQRRQLVWWKEAIGAYSLADVTPAMLAAQRDKLATVPNSKGQLRSAATVNRYLAVISHVLSTAAREWQWVEHNPTRNVTKHREPRGRVRFLSNDERDRLLAACQGHRRNPYLYPVVVLALSTGMRLGEIMALRWPDVDLERGRIILHETKNGERRTVPLVGLALRLLAEHGRVRRLDTDLLWPSPHDPQRPVSLRSTWLGTVKAAELDDFRFHDLRHSAASYLAMSGASLAEIAEVLGHKTLAMVKRYAHLSEGHTASVVERMAEKFLK